MTTHSKDIDTFRISRSDPNLGFTVTATVGDLSICGRDGKPRPDLEKRCRNVLLDGLERGAERVFGMIADILAQESERARRAAEAKNE